MESPETAAPAAPSSPDESSTAPSSTAPSSTAPSSTAPSSTAIGVGDILLHVGLHKTGTTSLQETLAADRDTLRAHGVLYPGSGKYHHRPVVAFLGGSFGWEDRGDFRPARRVWDDFLAQATAFPEGRTIISSEYLDDAPEDVVRSLAAEFPDPGRVHVAITVRSLARSLPSIWQQTLKSGSRSTFERFLNVMFGDDPRPTRERFWRRYRAADVAQRWVDVVGPDRVHVVVIPRNDREHIFQAFGQLLGLPEDFFADRDVLNDNANRSMSASEAEMIRRFNVAVAPHVEWPYYQRMVRNGAIAAMVNAGPAPDDRILAPTWAIERALASDRESAERLVAMGVDILGDPAGLYRDPPPSGDQPPDVVVPLDSAVHALQGLMTEALADMERREAKADRALQQARNQAQHRPPAARRSLARRGMRAVRRRWAVRAPEAATDTEPQEGVPG